MKVLFVQAPTNEHVWGGDAIFVTEPLWAEYLGAGLQNAHDTRLLDMRVDRTPLEHVLQDFEPDVVGMTAYTVDVNSVKRLAQRVKAVDGRTRVVVGGFFANKNYGQLRTPHIDVVVPGEGVNTLRELVDTWERAGLDADLRAVSGLAFPAEDGGMAVTSTRSWPSLDSYAYPDRSLSASIRSQYFDKWMKPVASITSSYSCPFRCEFCCLWPTTNGKYLSRSPESFVAEIETIPEENVWFTDDEAFIDGPRMERIARLLDERGIRKNYFFMTRSDSIRRNPQRFELWARAGLKRVMVGFESIRSQDLLTFRKDATVDDNDERDRHPSGQRPRDQLELHREPGLHPHRLRQPPALRRVQGARASALLHPHAVSRHGDLRAGSSPTSSSTTTISTTCSTPCCRRRCRCATSTRTSPGSTERSSPSAAASRDTARASTSWSSGTSARSSPA